VLVAGHDPASGRCPFVDPGRLRQTWATGDPITRCAGRLREMGALAEGELEVLDQQATETVDAAVLFAEESPWPEAL